MSMGSQQTGTQTQNQGPAPYAYPYVGTALNQAGQLLGSGGPKYYPGQQVAGFSQPQEQAFQGMTNLDQTLLNGGLQNPYLQDTFNQAANATQNQLSSEFGRAGADVGSSMPLRSQQLNQLATNIYGGQYQNSINNMFNAGQNELNIGNQIQGQGQNLINANMDKYNYYQNAPWQNLQRYESLIQPFMGGQSSQPLYSNPLAGLLGGGLAGAQVGGNIGGPWGAGIGALLGGGLGYGGSGG